jgi:soluble lytic murein transglycosylase-like protein
MSRIRVGLAILCVCAPLTSLADGGIYAFVDAEDRIHLSNVPGDERYRLLFPSPATVDAPAPRATEPDDPRRRYDALIRRAAGSAGIDAALLHAVIAVESGYDARAVSKRGAKGLMQLMPETARRYAVRDVFDPADNVRGGARYLAALLKMFANDLHLALAAYNAGEAAVLEHGRRIPPYPETAAYVPKVVRAYRKYRWTM